MPIMQIFTTLARSQIPENFPALVSQTLSKVMINKPVEKIVVHISPDQLIHCASEPNAPQAVAILRSIGSVDLPENRLVIREITKLIQNDLLISPGNIRLVFQHVSYDMIGLNGQVYIDMLNATPK